MTTTIDASTGGLKRNKDDLPVGSTLDRYRIEEPVGRGGMGTVYRAFDGQTNRFVALKLLADGIPKSLRDRFLAECEAEAAIRHEHVMPVYDRGWLNPERPYFVMELVYEPVTLDVIVDLVQTGKLASTYPRLRRWSNPRQLIADVVLPVIDGIGAANGTYNIQHRDIKPENVLIDVRTRRAYVIDFGICRAMDEATQAGKIVGTPRFLSPEQAKAQTDPRTDVWGLGNLIRYIYTAEPPIARSSPFTRKDVNERIAKLKEVEARSEKAGELAKARGYKSRREQLEDPEFRTQDDLLKDARGGVYPPLPEGVNSTISAIIQKAMAVDPALRYADAFELKKDLERWLRGETADAIAEGGAGSATLDRAVRWLKRNRNGILATLAGIVVGISLGMMLFASDPVSADLRDVDARDQVADIATRWDELRGRDAVRSMSGHVWARRVHSVEIDAQQLEKQLEALPIGPVRNDTLASLKELAASWAPSRLTTVNGNVSGRLSIEEIHNERSPIQAKHLDALALAPGLFRIRNKRIDLLVYRAVQPANSVPPLLHLGDAMVRHPEGLLWIPSTTKSQPQENPSKDDTSPEKGNSKAAPTRPFVASVELVTNSEYEAWLAEIDNDAERRRRVPPEGFERDRSGTKMWLAKADARSRPVQGISPQDAIDYIAWRSKIEEVSYRLPTDDEWKRMAGQDYLDAPCQDVFFPREGTTRNGHTRPRSGVARSPLGIRQLSFRGADELVLTAAGENEFRLKHLPDGAPTQRVLDEATPVEATDRTKRLVFRLVIVP